MVAEDCFQSLILEHSNQAIIITGESGAGKTEACKIILAYVSRASDVIFQGDPDKDLHIPGSGHPSDRLNLISVETYI